MLTTGPDDVAMSDLIPAHLAHLRASGYSEHTITSRAELLRRVHAALPYGLAYAATDEIESWLATKGWSQWTRCTYAMHIRGFYRWATRGGGLLDGDPTAEMAHPRTPRCLPNPVDDADLAAAMIHSGEPWYTAILLAAAAGLRADEIARLRREDVTEATITVQGKGGEPGIVDTHPQVWAHVQHRSAGPLVTDQHGRPVTGRWLSAHARHHFDSIGMPHVHLHRFRHWYGTALLDGGANLRTVQEAMRHRSVTSTQGYTMVRNRQRRHAIATLPIPTSTPQSDR